MTVALTTPIQIPNITRIHVLRCDADDTNQMAVMSIEARSTSGLLLGSATVQVGNGPSVELDRNPVPIGTMDNFVQTRITIVGAYDRVAAVLDGSGNRAAKLRALETLGLADGWLGSGLAGTVS